MSDLITSQMPKYKAYLEPSTGSLAVLLNKPRVTLETINDIDVRLVNLLRVIRDDPEELQYFIYHTLHPYERFARSSEIAVDPAEDARRMTARLWSSVGGEAATMLSFRKNISWNGPYTVYEQTDMLNRTGYAAARLRNAQIECKDGIQLIREHNDPDTLIYYDPPYTALSLVSNHYGNGFTSHQHGELLTTLVNHQGKVILSGYDSELYNPISKNWNAVEQRTKVGIMTRKRPNRTEVLWLNHEPNEQINLF